MPTSAVAGPAALPRITEASKAILKTLRKRFCAVVKGPFIQILLFRGIEIYLIN
jgi:hypothetical protein